MKLVFGYRKLIVNVLNSTFILFLFTYNSFERDYFRVQRHNFTFKYYPVFPIIEMKSNNNKTNKISTQSINKDKIA